MSCEGLETNCTYCTFNFFMINNSCLAECSIGYYFIDGSNFCLNCDTSCLTCQSSSTNCTSCRNDSHLNGSQCQINNYQKPILIHNVSANLFNDFTESQAYLLFFYNYTDSFIETFENYPSNSFQLNITQLTLADYSYKISKVSQGIYRFSFVFLQSISDSNIFSIYFNISFLTFPDINMTNSSVSICLASRNNLTYITASFGQITDPLTLPFSFSNSFPELFSMISNVSVASISNFQSKNFNFSIQNTSNPLIFNLILSYNVSIIGVHSLNLTFDLPPAIFDTNNTQLQTKTLTTPLINYFLLSDDEQASVSTTKAALTSVSSSTSAGINIFAFVNSGSAMLFTVLILMKCITYLKFLNINYPPNVLAVLEVDFSILNILPSFAIDHPDIPVDLKFEFYKMDNYVVNNLGNSLCEKLLIIFIAFSLNFLNGKCDKILKKNKHLSWIFNRIYMVMCWNFLFNSMISCLNDYFFFSLMNLSFPTYDKTGILNLSLSSFIFFFNICFVIFLYNKVLNIHQLLLMYNNEDLLDSPSLGDHSISEMIKSKRQVHPITNQELKEDLNPTSPTIKGKREMNLIKNEKNNMDSSSKRYWSNPFNQKPVFSSVGTFMSSIFETKQSNKKDNNQNSEKTDVFLQKYEILYGDFKEDSKSASTYFILDILKFPILSMIIILDRYEPLRQSILIFIVILFMLFFLIIVRPYKSTYLFIINIASQMCLLFCSGASFVLAYYDYINFNDEELRFFVGKIFVFGTLGLVYLMSSFAIGSSVIMVFQKIKTSIHQKLKKKL